MTTVIGICGYAQHGKNTTADILNDKFNNDYGIKSITRAFADPLREMASVLGAFVDLDTQLNYRDCVRSMGYERTKTAYPRARQFLQVLGTEAVRDILGEDTWVNALDNFVRHGGWDVVIVPDTRFENEVDYIKNHGILVGVERPGFDNKVDKNHPSEAYIGSAIYYSDYIITASTMDDLVDSAENVAYQISQSISAKLTSSYI